MDLEVEELRGSGESGPEGVKRVEDMLLVMSWAAGEQKPVNVVREMAVVSRGMELGGASEKTPDRHQRDVTNVCWRQASAPEATSRQ